MKTFQIAVLAAFGIAALIGLVFFATSKGIGGGSQSVGAVEIWGLLPQEAMTASLEELAAVDKRFSEVAYLEKPAASFSEDLAQAIAEGAGPDMVIITQEQLLSERAKLELIPFSVVPQRTFADTFVPMAELFLAEGGTYGLPVVVDPLVMYYSRPALTNAGIALPPSTWEAVSGIAQTVTRALPGGSLAMSAIPLGEYLNVRNARALVSAIFFQAGLPLSTISQGREVAALKGAGQDEQEAAVAALDFYTQFANPSKTVYTWNRSLPVSRDAFIAGSLVFYPGFASEEAGIRAANPNLDFDVAPLPQPATASVKATYGLLYSASVLRFAGNPAGALQVALALASPSASVSIAAASRMAPAHRAELVPPADDRFAAIAFQEALRARGWLSPAPAVTDGIFAGMIGNVTSGRRTVLQSLEAAQAALDEAL